MKQKELCKFVYDIRNSKEVRKICINPKPFKYKDHKVWFEKNKHKIKLIGKNKGYYFYGDDGFISICIHKDYRNKGIGKQVLNELEGKAIVLTNNPISFHVFIKAGWKLKGFYLEK